MEVEFGSFIGAAVSDLRGVQTSAGPRQLSEDSSIDGSC